MEHLLKNRLRKTIIDILSENARLEIFKSNT
jgi:hypothetical protein